MLIISDLHLSDGSGSDEFLQGGHLDELVQLLESQPDHSVILDGDIMDLLRSFLGDIIRFWGPLIDLIFRKAYVWLDGNHDAEALNFLDSQFRGVPIRDVMIIGSSLFMHGHQFDPYAKDAKSIGATITKLEDLAVRNTDPAVGEAMRTLEGLINGGREGEMENYANKAFRFIQNMWIEGSSLTRVRKIYLGHTHHVDCRTRIAPDNKELTYCNSGCWIRKDQAPNYIIRNDLDDTDACF